MKKKLLALVSAAALCLALAPAAALATDAGGSAGGEGSSASGEAITTVQVEVTVPLVGQDAATTEVEYRVAEEDEGKYTVTPDAGWQDAGGAAMTGSDSFQKGGEYRVSFTVVAKDGYYLAADTTVEVNGSVDTVRLLGGSSDTPASVFEFMFLPRVLGSIDSVELTSLPDDDDEELIGRQAVPYSVSGSNYEASGVWERYNAASGVYEPMSESDVFEDENLYRLAISIEPNVGYVFADYVELTVDGVFAESYSSPPDSLPYSKVVSYAEEIDEIVIDEDALPVANIGETFSPGSVSLEAPEDANYTLSAQWVFIDEEGVEKNQGAFENGKAYYLRIVALPKAGYSFSENLPVLVGDEYYYSDSPSESPHVTVNLRTSFLQVIDEVELFDVPVATLGASLEEGAFPVKVPAGAHYTASAEWCVYDNAYTRIRIADIEGNHVVTQGNRYGLEVTILSEAGYEFARPLVVWENGVEREVDNIYAPSGALYERIFSFCAVIDRIAVTGMTEPVVGEAPSYAGLSVPADAGYRISSAQWVDSATGAPVSVFEDGRDYELELYLEADSGYEFARGAVATVDDEKADAGINPDDAWLYVQRSFKEVLTEVRIDNVPAMKVGQTAQANPAIPSGASYRLTDAQWWVWNEAMGDYEPFAGVFESGKVYRLGVDIAALEGYRFSETDTAFFVNGQKSDDFVFLSYDGRTLSACYEKEYSAGLTLIDRIELRVDEPALGAHGSIDPVISIVSGTGFSLSSHRLEPSWMVGSIDKSTYFEDGYFAADENYGVQFALDADEGYVFADDVAVVVNGTTLPAAALNAGAKTMDARYFFSMEKDPASSDGDGSEGGTGGSSSAPSGSGLSNTGDASPTFACAALACAGLAACAAGATVAVRSRRRAR